MTAPARSGSKFGGKCGKRYTGRRPSSTDWLQILDIDGPFLAAPIVSDTWPDGLPALDSERLTALRAHSAIYDTNIGARDNYIRHVLTGTLDWRSNLTWGPDAARYAVKVPEHQTTVDITFAMTGQDNQGNLQPDQPLLLGMVLPPCSSTTGRAPAGGGTWPAGPADRLAHALRSHGVPLGLVTNGDHWTLVTITEGGSVSTATWTRHAWLEEPETLRAFVALLQRSRFLGVPDEQTLPGLLKASLARQEEVTERLSEQSQAVVEMLVATLGRIDSQHRAEHGTSLLPADVGPAEVYQGAVTVLMRLVFLLYAEERGLLPLDDDTYATTYAASTLHAELEERRRDQGGEDALERTATGWYRLLALFRAVHRGARHEQLLIPAYGGSLFDPDRYPWLEGRNSADETLGAQRVPAIDDRTLLRALDSLQFLQFAKERRQVSYRSLDVEQIGYVYEGLLDQDARRADGWILSIAVSDRDLRKNGPELALTDIETRHAKGNDALATWLHEQTKTVGTARSKASILKALTPPTGAELLRHARLVREACGNDDTITERVMPYARLLRLDPRDLPVVYPPSSLYLTDSDARTNTGAVYTPRFLAEQVVAGALEPIVYNPGPLDTGDKTAWRIKRPEQILDLKVADIAAGSGAFLVAATRYLANKLLEARRTYGSPGRGLDAPDTMTVNEATPRYAAQRTEEHEIDARRAIIDHCIYGVDINPMAVEMAKLSLWLVTLDRNRPFGFLDDRLAVGDSLLGITSADQIRDLHLHPKAGRRIHEGTLELFTADTDRLLKEAAEIRQAIALIDLRDTRDADQKARLLEQAQRVTARVALVADGLAAASLAGGADSNYIALAALVADAEGGKDADDQALRQHIAFQLTDSHGTTRRPAHYPLLFPEAFSDGRQGFDGIIGNPPFLGRGKISGALGNDYRGHLGRVVASGRRAKRPDLAAFFLLRAAELCRSGVIGLITTNSIAQGDTREIGLDALLAEGHTIVAAVKSEPWPTRSAALEYSCVWLTPPALSFRGIQHLDGQVSGPISGNLDPVGYDWTARRLGRQAGIAFMGSVLHGIGFVMDRTAGEAMILADSRNAEVVKPCLGGEELSQNPGSEATRWVVDFGTMKREQASEYELPWRWVEERVRPGRQALDPKPYKRIIDNWWQFWAPRSELYMRLEPLERVIAITLVSKTVMPTFVSSRQVFQHTVGVVALDDRSMLAAMSSSIHYWWTLAQTSTMKKDVRYTLSDVFETFVPPPPNDEIARLAESLYSERREMMLRRRAGLTSVYNAVHGPDGDSGDWARLRDLHVALDEAVVAAYGWTDLRLDHARYETKQGARFTVAPNIRQSFVRRMLEMNHYVYADELASGLSAVRTTRLSRQQANGVERAAMLFGDDT